MLKLSDRSFLGELEESPFTLFVTMEMERDDIYSEYSEIDEIHEISDEWMRFSVSCAKSLNLVAILSQLLHERYYDELSKDQERIAQDGDRFTSITKRIQGIIQLEAESSLLMLTYANMRNTGVFGQTPPAGFCDYYLSALSHLDRIQELFFVYEHPRLPEINKILRSLSTLEKTKRILPYLDLLDDKNSDFAVKERGIYEITEGSFNSEILGEFINVVGGDSPTSYWWPDSITEHFVFSKAVDH
ncbi:MAG: hypothetical protein KAR35_10260, partial [Candidatus Heimdallarchaeota archaeon]|nr:hypothetical protein [Candidatus Heimdallarchaeota archaeon]MCK5049739.1 hypothetical protein [Candidatus Heimdallarchaeota archaeon]